jgi:hypothetical protein
MIQPRHVHTAKQSMLLLGLVVVLSGRWALGQTAPANQWELREGKDSMSDLPVASIRVSSESKNGTFVLACQAVNSPIVSFQFLPKRYLGTSDPKIMDVRFDGYQPVSIIVETSFRGVYTSDAFTVRRLSNLLAKSKTLTIRAWNYERQPIESKFSVTGGEALIRKVLSTCNYAFEVEPTTMSPAIEKAPADDKKSRRKGRVK